MKSEENLVPTLRKVLKNPWERTALEALLPLIVLSRFARKHEAELRRQCVPKQSLGTRGFLNTLLRGEGGKAGSFNLIAARPRQVIRG
jgi:hypothetical protein